MDYKLKTEAGKFGVKGGSLEMKVKRGDVSFGWFLVAYNIILTIFVSVVSIIPCIGFFIKFSLIILGSILLFKFCLFNGWFRNKVVGLFSKAKEMEEVSGN